MMPRYFNYGDRTIFFDLSFEKRKTLKITVEPPDRVLVTAPAGLPNRVVVGSVRKKARWIVEKLTCFGDMGLPPSRRFVDDETFMYLGRDYSLRVSLNLQAKRPTVALADGMLFVDTPVKEPEAIRNGLGTWYRRQAMEKIEERVQNYQHRFTIRPMEIKVKEQKKRWGSCTGSNRLLFNWRCIMAPAPVLDYVVIHEMCHMVHKNHSPLFWNMVASILPDYKSSREWLRVNGIRMAYNL
jgi:predicted metal-dependent hydrolase